LDRTVDLQERQVRQLRVLESTLEELVNGRPVGWDEEESARRRQDLKLRIERTEEERLHPGQERRLKPGEEERLEQDIVQEQVQRRGLRMRL
jgi:hypothetical protein